MSVAIPTFHYPIWVNCKQTKDRWEPLFKLLKVKHVHSIKTTWCVFLFSTLLVSLRASKLVDTLTKIQSSCHYMHQMYYVQGKEEETPWKYPILPSLWIGKVIQNHTHQVLTQVGKGPSSSSYSPWLGCSSVTLFLRCGTSLSLGTMMETDMIMIQHYW